MRKWEIAGKQVDTKLSGFYAICPINGFSAVAYVAQKDHAELIARAPEMAAELEVLKAERDRLNCYLVSMIDDCLDLDGKGRAMVRDIHGWDKINDIRAALSKAQEG